MNISVKVRKPPIKINNGEKFLRLFVVVYKHLVIMEVIHNTHAIHIHTKFHTCVLPVMYSSKEKCEPFCYCLQTCSRFNVNDLIRIYCCVFHVGDRIHYV